MDASGIVLGEFVNAGVSGFVAVLIWHQIQQSKQLIAEIRERDNALMQIIIRLLDERKST